MAIDMPPNSHRVSPPMGASYSEMRPKVLLKRDLLLIIPQRGIRIFSIGRPTEFGEVPVMKDTDRCGGNDLLRLDRLI